MSTLSNLILCLALFSFSITASVSHASLIGDTITIEVDSTIYQDVVVSNSVFDPFGILSEPSLIPGYRYNESTDMSVFQFFAQGGQSYAFTDLDWIDSTGYIVSAYVDPSPAITIASINFDPSQCIGDPSCEADFALFLANAVNDANALSAGLISFSDSSMTFSPQSGRGLINLTFSTEHFSVPIANSLALLVLGLLISLVFSTHFRRTNPNINSL